METNSFFKRLRKHWLVIVLGFLGLVLLGTGGYYSVISYKAATPIARIEPKDSITTSSPGSKLESYKKQMLEQEKEAYRRRLALDEIVSMDFSKGLRDENVNKFAIDSKSHTNKDKPLENTYQRADSFSVVPATPSKPLLRKGKPLRKQVQPIYVSDGFQTLKVGEKEKLDNIQVAAQPFIKALIFGDQKVKTNGSIRIRLAEKLALTGATFPINTIVSGRIISQSNGRMKISIAQINGQRASLQVHDQDFGEGIAYQTKEVIEETANEAKSEALDEVLSALPYGGIAGGLAKLGKNAARKTRRPATFYLADGYQLFLTIKD